MLFAVLGKDASERARIPHLIESMLLIGGETDMGRVTTRAAFGDA